MMHMKKHHQLCSEQGLRDLYLFSFNVSSDNNEQVLHWNRTPPLSVHNGRVHMRILSSTEGLSINGRRE